MSEEISRTRTIEIKYEADAVIPEVLPGAELLGGKIIYVSLYCELKQGE